MQDVEAYILQGLLSYSTSKREIAQEVKANMDLLLQTGGPALLGNTPEAKLAEIAIAFNQQTDSFLDADALSAILAAKPNLQQEEVVKIEFLFRQAASKELERGKFRWWLYQLREAEVSAELADILTKGATILEGRVEAEDGIIHQGSKDAVVYLQTEVSKLASSNSIHVQPSGDVRKDWKEVLEETSKAERGEVSVNGISTGFNFIDDVCKPEPTDFLLVGAHIGEGKSLFCANLAWHLCTMEAKNGVLITAETARSKYRRRIYTRHTHLPGIGIVGGVPYDSIRDGRWQSEKHRETYARCAKDFGSNPAYGILDITQVTAGSSIADVRSIAESFQSKFNKPLHYLIVDYLALISSVRNRGTRREEITEILAAFKELCLTFDNGRGLLGIAAHQTKQDVREKVKPEPGKFYTIRDYSDTSEAGKSIDTGIMLYRDDELKKLNEVAAALVKVRDSDCPSEIFRLYENYVSSYLGNLARAA